MTEETKSEMRNTGGKQQDKKKSLPRGCKWVLVVIALAFVIFAGFALSWAMEQDYQYNIVGDNNAR